MECGEALLKHGYKLKFFNTINFSKSMRYNPMAYIHSEKDVLKLVTALMTNTKGEGQGGDPFWDKAERLLLVSLIAYPTLAVSCCGRTMRSLSVWASVWMAEWRTSCCGMAVSG